MLQSELQKPQQILLAPALPQFPGGMTLMWVGVTAWALPTQPEASDVSFEMLEDIPPEHLPHCNNKVKKSFVNFNIKDSIVIRE